MRDGLVVDLGVIPYADALDLQRRLASLRHSEALPDVLLVCQHPPVVTVGRAGSHKHIGAEVQRHGVPVFEVERGGDVTYHGPGQLVGYPILNLKQHGQDLNRYLRDLEEVVIRTLACYNVTARRDPRFTGVWVDDEKICAIGVAVKRWVSFHGFAFNLDPNLEHFRLIVPCGIRDHGVTSLAKVLGRPVDEEVLRGRLIDAFSQVFDLRVSLAGGPDALREWLRA